MPIFVYMKKAWNLDVNLHRTYLGSPIFMLLVECLGHCMVSRKREMPNNFLEKLQKLMMTISDCQIQLYVWKILFLNGTLRPLRQYVADNNF